MEPAIPSGSSPSTDDVREEGTDLLDVAVPIAAHWRLLILGPLVAGAMAFGASFLIPPTYTAVTTFLPPQQQQSATASALASLGALSGFAGAAFGIRTPGDQYVSLLQSTTVADRLIEAFDLMSTYDVQHRFEARRELARNVRIALGKKDGLVTVEVDDHDPQRAADLANRHVEELRRLTGELALTEAQQRRLFFQTELEQTRDRLAAAQRTLEGSGFDAGALRAEPRTAAEGYARLKAEVTAAEVRLQTLRRSLTDATPEVQQQQTLLSALRRQLAQLESAVDRRSDGDYIGRYREYKYQEALFDLFSRQFEMARLDESREGALIQVVDAASPPEAESKPRRKVMALGTTFGVGLLLAVGVLVRYSWHGAARRSPRKAAQLAMLKSGRHKR